MTDEIPKQDLLTKLLKMTSSSNDGEVLVAIRKANALLQSAGWDWDKLIQGKIKVIADPFANTVAPTNPAGNGVRHAPAPPAAPRRAPPPPPPGPGRPIHPQPRPTAPPPPPPKPFEPYSARSTQGMTNIYPGACWCCGADVDKGAGKLFVAQQFNSRVKDNKKKVICTACDGNRYANVGDRPAPRQYYTGTSSLNDL